MALDQFMVHCVTLERLTDQRGATAARREPIYIADSQAECVQCSIQPASSRTRIAYMQNQLQVTHTLYFKADWNPNIRDRWRFDQPNRRRYFVVHGWYESLFAGDTWTCDCEEVIISNT
jgi:hypothetical protein